MPKQRILLLDTSSILHAVKHSGAKRLKHRDKPVYIIFGFMMKLQFMMKKIHADVIVFANDSADKDSKRKKMYPTYKEKRSDKSTRTPEQVELDEISYPQFSAVLNIVIPKLGYKNIFKEKGLEADDIIGSICKTYVNCEIFMVTTDKDMYQLLTPTICIFNPMTHKFYTYYDFKKQYGVEPKMWKRVKAIAGCSSDEVKGVKGVGEKTALKYIKGALPTHYKTYKDIESEYGKKIIRRNKPLVILPFRGTPKYKIQADQITKARIQRVANRYGFASILNNINEWVRVLRGKK